MTDETEKNYGEWTNDELRDEIEGRNEAHGKTLSTSGNKPDLVKTLEDDDAAGATAGAAEGEGDEAVTTVTDLPDEVKTGPVLRREERAERVAGEAAAYERQHEVTTPQQSGVFADVAEQQAAEARGEVRERERE